MLLRIEQLDGERVAIIVHDRIFETYPSVINALEDLQLLERELSDFIAAHEKHINECVFAFLAPMNPHKEAILQDYAASLSKVATCLWLRREVQICRHHYLRGVWVW